MAARRRRIGQSGTTAKAASHQADEESCLMFTRFPKGGDSQSGTGCLVDEVMRAAAETAFPVARYHAVSEWLVLATGGREWCLWTSDDGEKWKIRVRAASQHELLFQLESYIPAPPLRVVSADEKCSAGAAHSQRAARRNTETPEI
jgi:hypothetical protein